MSETQPTTVIKIGGAAGVNYGALCDDVAALWQDGQRIVLVHGGSAATDALAARLDHPQRTITTPSGHVSRYTDRATLEIFAMATAQINRSMVEGLQGRGVPALGLSGLDGRLLHARRKEAIRSVENGRVRLIRDDWTGTIDTVNDALLRTLLDAGYLPVIAPLACSEAGQMLNVDGDRAAAAIAGALGATRLLLLSNVAGLLRRFPDESSLVTQLGADDVQTAQEWAQGRMKRKLVAAAEALAQGVKIVVIGDGRQQRAVQAAIDGAGTHIVAAGGHRS